MTYKKNLILLAILLLVGVIGYLLFHPENLFPGQSHTDISKTIGRQVLVQTDVIEKPETRKPDYKYSIDCDRRIPQGVATYQDKLYVSYNQLNIIDIFDYQGKRLEMFVPYQQRPINIVALEVDRQGNVYLIDTKNKTTMVFDQNNSFLYLFPPNNIKPSSEGYVELPISITIQNTFIFITDMEDKSVKMYSLTGEYLMSIKGSGKGEAQAWTPVAVDQTKDGRLIVSDIMAKNIAVFSCDGKFAHIFNDAEGSLKLSAPVAMAIDSLGRIHVVDNDKTLVFVYDNYGRFLFTYGESDTSEAVIQGPRSIAIDKIRDLIFIANSMSKNISVWSY